MSKLILIHHGQSEWNLLNQLTGRVDVNLLEKGVEEAKRAGRLIKKHGLKSDQVYTPVLKRAIRALHSALEESDQLWIPEIESWKLNERHYGALQGLNKRATAEKYGDEQVHIWCRSYDALPPAIDDDNEYSQAHDRRYSNLDPNIVPKTENLHACSDRVIPSWGDHVAPDLLAGKNVIIAAHGNSLRALIKCVERISDEDVMDLEMKVGESVVYTLDDKLNVTGKVKLDD